jgi:hypothetical protein
MQRSIAYKKPLVLFLSIVLFVIYESLSSIYLLLPPLLAVLFVLLGRALDKKDIFGILIVSFCLLIFEADKGFILFTSIIYFLIVQKFILPKLIQNFNCTACVNILYVLLAYLGFYLFSYLLSNIFLLPMPSINYYVIYYIVIEFLIVSIL